MIVYIATRMFAALYGYAWPIADKEIREKCAFLSCFEFVAVILFAGVAIAAWISNRKGNQ